VTCCAELVRCQLELRLEELETGEGEAAAKADVDDRLAPDGERKKPKRGDTALPPRRPRPRNSRRRSWPWLQRSTFADGPQR
jgi:hypothetical protein